MRRCSGDASGLLMATLRQAGMSSACLPPVYRWNWKIMKNVLNLRHLLLLPLLAVLAACGGGGGGSSTGGGTTTPTLVSIAVTPANSTMAIGTSQQFTATGTFTDSSTSALTVATGLTWGAKGSNITVGTTGIVTGKAVGPHTVTATVGTVTGSTPVTINAPWRAVAAGGYHTVARKADGTLLSWGSNQFGQLGDGTNVNRLSPVQVQVTAPTTGSTTVSPWTMIAAGEYHTVALRADGTLWAWGNNQNGQLGDGTQTNRSVPTKIGTGTGWLYVAAGKSHTIAIDKGGLLWAWGRNFNGQLGDNTTADKLVPTKIGVATNWSSAAAGATHTLARRADGTLWAWGGNANGQLGNGGLTDLHVPTQIGTSTWVAVAAGTLHSAAIRADGALFAWGSNGNGQVGNGLTTTTNVTAPLQISKTTPSNWIVIGAGDAYTVGVRVDGTLWAWGSNSDGQLGDGSGLDSSTPNQIGTVTNWSSALSAGLFHAFGIRSDGTLWGWGRNVEGQQGNGDATGAAVPTPVNRP